MAEFTVRSDSVDVEQIMRQIRARIREKRGADYTEAELHRLASVKLEAFLDPKSVRSDLVEQFRRRVTAERKEEFTEAMLYQTHRPWLRGVRRMLNPILKLFINPAAISGAVKREEDLLFYEVVHNLVVETTRLGIEVQNLKMRAESLSSRVDFDERRAKAFEGSHHQRPSQQQRPRQNPPAAPMQGSAAAQPPSQPGYSSVVSTPVAAEPGPNSGVSESERGRADTAGSRPDGVKPDGHRADGSRPDAARPDGNRPDGNGSRTDGLRPDGSRRRRRRRRRRPGQNMAAGQGEGAPANGGGSPQPAHNGSESDGPDDDGADDGADDQ